MPCLEGMHAPGSERAHLLPRAGIKEEAEEVYRFNRVTPVYPPDPCIRPNEADLVCAREDTRPKNHPNMPAAGANNHPIVSDRFAFYKAREGTSKMPCQSGGRKLTQEKPCPCSNSAGGSTFDLQHLRHSQHHTNQHPETRLTDCQTTQPKVGRHHQSLRPTNQGLTHAKTAQPNNHATFNRPMGYGSDPSCNQQAYPGSQFSHGSHMRSDPTQMIPNQYAVLGNASYGRDYITTSNAPFRHKTIPFGEEPDPACPNKYYPAPYICQPVYNRKYLDDCPEQDGPPADSYTFL